MLFSKSHREYAQPKPKVQKRRGRGRVLQVIAKIELLDQRIFLTGNPSSYAAPSSISVVTLQASQDGLLYDVDYYLNGSLSASGTLSPSSTDESISITGQVNGFKMVDQIAAAAKPTGGVNFHLVGGATGGTIEVDAQPADTYMTITASTSSSATVVTNDSNDYADLYGFGGGGPLGAGDNGYDYSGAGVSQITLQTIT